MAADKESFCTQWSWAGSASVPFPDSKSGCSVIHLCQQFQAVRIEIGDNRAEGRIQSSPSATSEPCFSLYTSYKREMMKEITMVINTVPEAFPSSGTVLLRPAALVLVNFIVGLYSTSDICDIDLSPQS